MVLCIFFLIAAFFIAKPFFADAAPPSGVLTDTNGKYYVQVGTQKFDVTEKGGQYFTTLGGKCVVSPGCLVDGGSYSAHVSEILANQAVGGKNDPQTVFGQVTSAAGKFIAEKIAKAVLYAVVGVLSIIAYFCKWLVELAGHMLDFTLNPQLYNFTSNEMIIFGWTMVRDICNLFFLIILLFIAFCTILQIDKYHAKKTLLTLILMALLINFSKPIAIFIFDGAQIAMNYFLKSITWSTGGDSTSAIYSSITKIAESIYNNLPEKAGLPEVAVQYLFAIVFLFMLAIAYLTIAVFLVIRIVAVMVLIIVSPLAFLAMAVPDFQKMSSSWWSALFSYSYYGPAVAFFLLLATKLGEFTSTLPKLTNGSTEKTMVGLTNNTLHYLTTIVFLYAAVIMGKQFGLYASDAITSRATKGINWGARNLTGYGLAAKGGRGIANVFKRHKQAATDAGKEALKQKYPRVHRWVTKEGSDAAAKKYWNEKFGNTNKNRDQQEAVGKHEKDMKDKNFTEADYQKELKSTDATRRMAAAMALVKMGKLDFKQYKNALNDFKNNDAFKKLFDNEVKKKSIHVAIDAEVEEANKKIDADTSLTSVQKDAAKTVKSQEIHDKHLSDIKPSDIADQNVGELMNRKEFVSFANDNYSHMSPGVKTDLAKKLSANDLWKFQGMGWV
jgi:hypothetical protein